MDRLKGLFLDLDGTVYEDDSLVPGADRAIAALRARGLAIRFVTNTTRLSRAAIAARLEGLGIPAVADDVFAPPRAALSWIRERGLRRVAACLPEDALRELAGVELVNDTPEVVVVGDLGPAWTFEGVPLVALHRNRYWRTGGELVLDVGAFVAAFEYATGRQATLVGKPSRALFEAAAGSVGRPLSELAMVGDDLQTDIAGSQALGVASILVRTGKSRAGGIESSGIHPDLVVDSLAALPDSLP
jgi:phospholysine phosphohistidine inorganic pyrophosphate phosphatase